MSNKRSELEENTKKIKTILITGGLGYIGSHLTLYLLSLGYDVIIIDNKTNNYVDDIPGARIYIGNILSTTLLKKIFKYHEIDCVIHLAALKNINESQKKFTKYYDVNVIGTLSLISASNCKNIIFASSASVYGNKRTKCSIDSKVKPQNIYAKTKYISEQGLKKLNGHNVTILRIFNPIGFQFKGNLNGANIMDNICKSMIYTQPLIIHNQGKDIRDYVYIGDVVKEIESCINNTGFNIRNVGTGIGTTTNELVQMFPEVMDLVEYDKSRKPIKVVSTDKIETSKTLPEIVCEVKEVMQL
jgi:UDP-glucose 4-epimerase